jgi:hypothetical protein
MRIDIFIPIAICVLAAIFLALWIIGKRERATSRIDIPRKLLVIPVVFTLFSFGAIWLAERLGAHLNIHGGGGLLILPATLAGALTVFVECIVIPRSVLRLVNTPALRTTSNICSVLLAASFVLFAFGSIAVGFWWYSHET